jgi:peroxiredoxin
MAHHLQDLPGTPGDIRPLFVGAKIPELTLQRVDGSPVDLGDEIAKKPTVLIFYRGGW